MAWDATMLFVHIGLLLGLVMLYRNAPDALQQIVIGLLVATFLTLIYLYAKAAIGDPVPWIYKAIAHGVEHVAVCLYIVRTFVSDQERRCLPKPSPQSRSS